MPRIAQKDFFKSGSEFGANRISHGGAIATNKRKTRRPLAANKPVHLLMKSSSATGRLSFLGAKNRLQIHAILRKTAAKYRVTVRAYENVGNHLHLLLAFKTREEFQNFLRTLTATIARFVTGARKGKSFRKNYGKRFWDHLAFTRIITGRRDYASILNYFFKNKLERDLGHESREAVEIHERAERLANRRGVNVEDILFEWSLVER